MASNKASSIRRRNFSGSHRSNRVRLQWQRRVMEPVVEEKEGWEEESLETALEFDCELDMAIHNKKMESAKYSPEAIYGNNYKLYQLLEVGEYNLALAKYQAFIMQASEQFEYAYSYADVTLYDFVERYNPRHMITFYCWGHGPGAMMIGEHLIKGCPGCQLENWSKYKN